MKIKSLLLSALVLLTGCAVHDGQAEYLVIAGQGIQADSSWNNVVGALQAKHDAAVLSYDTDIDELLPEIRKINPRYVAIVEKPETVGRDYVMHLNRISRTIDDDVYADFLWGIITGYDSAAAMRMVDNSTEPLVVKDAISTITELHCAKWFDHYAWIDDHQQGLWGEKKSPEDTVVTHQLPLSPVKMRVRGTKDQYKIMDRANSSDVMQLFADLYKDYDPDLVVTAAHATERNLEMPFSLGNVKAKEGRLYMDLPENPTDLYNSGKRKIYLPIGNCLIGNMDNTPESMAAAWMNSGNAATMVGYVVTTWYGRNGWGGLKYWLTHSGRYTAAEAFYLNQQDMMYQLNRWSPVLTRLEYPYTDNEFEDGLKVIADSTGLEVTPHHLGFLHDRDVLAYYGDPKWDVRLQEIPEEKDFSIQSEIKGSKCIITITTDENFSMERMKGDHFKEEHVLDLPFSYFFPQRLNNPRLSKGQDWELALDENFMLIYNFEFEPEKTYTIELDFDK